MEDKRKWHFKVHTLQFIFTVHTSYFTLHSSDFTCQTILLLWIFNVFVLSCVCYVFVRVCLYVLCGHLLGKGWPLGSRLWCLTVISSLSHWYPWSGVVLDCIDSWSLHPYLLFIFHTLSNVPKQKHSACWSIIPHSHLFKDWRLWGVKREVWSPEL